MTEFNLSDRRFSNDSKLKRPIPYPYYLESDVKEFIKRLKDGFLDSVKTMTFEDYVDSLAGDKLKEQSEGSSK